MNKIIRTPSIREYDHARSLTRDRFESSERGERFLYRCMTDQSVDDSDLNKFIKMNRARLLEEIERCR